MIHHSQRNRGVHDRQLFFFIRIRHLYETSIPIKPDYKNMWHSWWLGPPATSTEQIREKPWSLCNLNMQQLSSKEEFRALWRSCSRMTRLNGILFSTQISKEKTLVSLPLLTMTLIQSCPPPWSYLNIITSQSLYLHFGGCVGELQHMDLEEQKYSVCNILPLASPNLCLSHAKYIYFIPTALEFLTHSSINSKM